MDNSLAAGTLAVLVCLIGLAHTVYNLNYEGIDSPVLDPLTGGIAAYLSLEGTSALNVIELITRLPVVIMSVVILIGGTAASAIAGKFESAMAAAVAGNGTLDAYFEASDAVDSHLEFLDLASVFCFITLCLQIFQLISYFHRHPGMAYFSSTALHAMSNILHFLVLFVILFLLSTFLAYWMFGEELAAFSTLGRALTSQMQMVYGHFLSAPEATALDGDAANMYWIYALTFAVVVFFVMLDLLVAMIIDSFGELKESLRGRTVARIFMLDVIDSMFATQLYGSRGWPSAVKLVEWLEGRSDPPPASLNGHLTFADISERFAQEPRIGKNDPAQEFLVHYGNKLPHMVWFASEADLAAEQPLTVSPTAPDAKGSPDDDAQKQRLIRMAMEEIASQLADRQQSRGPQSLDVDWLAVASRLSCSFYREFREHRGPIKDADASDASKRD